MPFRKSGASLEAFRADKPVRSGSGQGRPKSSEVRESILWGAAGAEELPEKFGVLTAMSRAVDPLINRIKLQGVRWATEKATQSREQDRIKTPGRREAGENPSVPSRARAFGKTTDAEEKKKDAANQKRRGGGERALPTLW